MEHEEQIKFLITQIKNSKDAMRTRYVVWDVAESIKNNYKGTPSWNRLVIKSHIPESRIKTKAYTPKRFHLLLKSKDYEIAAAHLVWIFSLFDSLIFYLNQNKFKVRKTRTKTLAVGEDLRNIYVHQGGKPNKKFISNFKRVMKRAPKVSEGIVLPEIKDIEIWNDIIIRKTNNFIREYNLS